MSQNISIKEGNESRQFGHVKKLKIANSGGGSSLWVPEDEVQTKSLYASKNGVYIAANGSYVKTVTKTRTVNGKQKKESTKVIVNDPDRACYGYDEVSVNIINSVSGKFDLDGNDFVIDVGDDGFLEETMVPSYIKIITPPSKLEYIATEFITLDGIYVKAYYEDDTEWGDVPSEELRPNPSIASQSEEKSIDGYTPKSSAWGELELPDDCIPWHYTQGHGATESGSYGPGQYDVYDYSLVLNGVAYVGKFNGDNAPYLFFVSDQPISYSKAQYYTGPYSGAYQYSFEGHTYYALWLSNYALGPSLEGLFNRAPMNSNMEHGLGNDKNARDLMRIFYGNKSGEPSSDSIITVEWDRIEDGETLTDTYEISVSPLSSQENNMA